jgi:hypothetical protein
MRQTRFVREDFPRRIEEGFGGSRIRNGFCTKRKPRFQILMKRFLRLDAVGYGDDWAFGKELVENKGEEGLRRGMNAGIRQDASLLHARAEVLQRGSGHD